MNDSDHYYFKEQIFPDVSVYDFGGSKPEKGEYYEDVYGQPLWSKVDLVYDLVENRDRWISSLLRDAEMQEMYDLDDYFPKKEFTKVIEKVIDDIVNEFIKEHPDE